MKFDYSGGVLEHERPTIEKFEDELLPYLTKLGEEIGSKAMQGDSDAEEIIRRYNQFCNGMPDYRPQCFKFLVAALKRFDSKRMN